jgi:hypothetical protein
MEMFERELFEGREVYDRIEYNRNRKCKCYENYLMGFCDNMKRMY